MEAKWKQIEEREIKTKEITYTNHRGEEKEKRKEITLKKYNLRQPS